MHANRLVTMDIEQIRGWAAFMDKAMIASLVATILAVTALGVTTWLSFRYGNAVRTYEQVAFEQYKGLEGRVAHFEQEAATARDRASALEREMSAAREHAATLEREVSTERERAASFEQAARAADERATLAARDGAAAGEKPRAPTSAFAASEIRQRLADVGKMVREAAAKATASTPAAPPPPPPSPFVAALQKFTGTKAAVFVVGQVADAPAVGKTISDDLTQAGWTSGIWTWSGVAGIVGVVVLTRDGSDAATIEAATAVTEALSKAGYSATKGDWPANWGRFRGVLNGPESPSPTDASIRIVIGSGSKAH
jgi:hypothetical protein